MGWSEQECKDTWRNECTTKYREECNDVPYQDCYDVPKEKCVQESWQDCQDYPRQECKDVHSKVPRQVAKQIPIRVCGDRRELYNAEPSFDGSGVFDVRSDGDEHDPEDDVETIAFGQQKEKIDPGLFSQQTEDTISIIKKGNANNEDDVVGFVFSDK